MRRQVVLSFCVLSVVSFGSLRKAPSRLENDPELLQFMQNQHFSPINLSTTNSLTNAGLYNPLCFQFDDHRIPGQGQLRNEITMEQCKPVIDSLIEEHDVDVWLRRGQRFQRNQGLCYIAVRGPTNQSDNPYVGATYGDLARLMIRILSVCTVDAPGPRKFGKGGRIRIGKDDDEWLGFWLEVQGQPFMWQRPTRLRLPSTVSNITSVEDITS